MIETLAVVAGFYGFFAALLFPFALLFWHLDWREIRKLEKANKELADKVVELLHIESMDHRKADWWKEEVENDT